MKSIIVSGNIVQIQSKYSIPVDRLSVAIEPVQDLHGYDSPWPDGGRINKLPSAEAETKTVNGITVVSDGNGVYTFTGSTTTQSALIRFALPAEYTIQDGDYFHLGNSVGSNKVVINLDEADGTNIVYPATAPANRIYSLSSCTGRAIGQIRFYVAANVSNLNLTCKPMVCQTSTATTFSPYANICPITGCDGVKVNVREFNLWDGTSELGYIDINNGEERSSDTNHRTGFIPIIPGLVYCYSNQHVASGIRLVFYDENKQYISYVGNASPNPQTFTAPANARFARFYWGDIEEACLNISSGRDGEYEPYRGETYDITFPSEAGTVYGGTLDVTTGLLTVDKKYHAVTSDDVTGLFQTGTNANRVGIRLPDSRPSPSGLRLDILCNKARPSIDILTQSAFRVGDCCIYSGGSDTYSTALFGVPITATTGPDAKAYLISEGYAFVYSLATPVTYQLDPVTVSMIQGTNNIWADAGEIEVEYKPCARVIFDGINTVDYDAYVYPTDTMHQAPAHQYTMLTVPGRSGSLLIDEKRFDNIDREYGVVIAESGKVNIDLLRNALASRGGYFRLEDTFDTTHFFMATYNKIFTPAIDWRGNSAKITLSFNCKPQRYLKSGETVIDMSSSGNITNPTRFSAKPLLRVYGNGVLSVGSTNITITGNTYSYVDIDCDMGRAYYGATPLDSKITLNTIDYPELAPGNNGIVLGTGITRVIITPRWWEL